MGIVNKIKEQVRILFSVEDLKFDFESILKKEMGYEFVSYETHENTTNSNWPKWSIIVNYKRYKK